MIKRLLVSDLEIDPRMLAGVDEQTPLLGLGIGLDSIEALRLALALEREFDLRIPDFELTVDLFASLGGLTAYICQKLAMKHEPA